MADAEETSVNVFFIIGVIALLGFVGLGLWYFFAPRAEVDTAAGDAPRRTAVADIENEEARDSLARKLVLSRYELQRVPAVVSGTVVNNTGRPFVNVQVGFHLFDASGSRVGAVRDTAPVVEADDSWIFRIGLPADQVVTRVEPEEVQGTPKAPLGPNPSSVHRREEGLGPSVPDSAASQQP